MPSRDFEHYFESRFLHANIFANLANFMILTCPVKFFQYSQTSHQVSSLEVNFKGFYRPVNIANQCAKFRVHANFFGVSLHFFNLVGIELSINACKQVILVIFVKFVGKTARLIYTYNRERNSAYIYLIELLARIRETRVSPIIMASGNPVRIMYKKLYALCTKNLNTTELQCLLWKDILMRK